MRDFSCGHMIQDQSAPFCAWCELDRLVPTTDPPQMATVTARAILKPLLIALETLSGEDCLSAIGQGLVEAEVRRAIEAIRPGAEFPKTWRLR